MTATIKRLEDLTIEKWCSYVLATPLNENIYRNGDNFIPAAISDKLLHHMSCQKGHFTDDMMFMFERQRATLERVKIQNGSLLTIEGLKILQRHNLKEFRIKDCNLSFKTLCDLFNRRTASTIQALEWSNSFNNLSWQQYILPGNLASFVNLRELDVHKTSFNTHQFEFVVEHLGSNLRKLNISGTRIDSLYPLKETPNLISLNMSNLSQVDCRGKKEDIDDIILSMQYLQHLDCSHKIKASPFQVFFTPSNFKAYHFQMLNYPTGLPDLVFVDVTDVSDDYPSQTNVIKFVDNHPKLKFLGLMVETNVQIFSNPNHISYRPDLQIAGSGSMEQIALGLKTNWNNEHLVRKCLGWLYDLKSNFNIDANHLVIKMIIDYMEKYNDDEHVQEVGTACFYYLTRSSGLYNDFNRVIPMAIINLAVECIYNAMEKFRLYYPIQKYALLTLCNERIIIHPHFNKLRCAKLVLRAFTYHNDPETDKCCVMILSNIGSKITLNEIMETDSDFDTVLKFVKVVRDKSISSKPDHTLFYTVSALWSLTSGSSNICTQFVKHGGLCPLVHCIKNAVQISMCHIKILAVLNNIVEFPHLRADLLKEDIIDLMNDLLIASQVKMSYFVAGIMANILSTEVLIDDKRVHEILEMSIRNWGHPNVELVPYHNLTPFIPLLKCYHVHQVQLWALWALQHVLMANAEKYFKMLTAENIPEILNELLLHCNNEFVHEQVTTIIEQMELYKRRQIDWFEFN